MITVVKLQEPSKEHVWTRELENPRTPNRERSCPGSVFLRRGYVESGLDATSTGSPMVRKDAWFSANTPLTAPTRTWLTNCASWNTSTVGDGRYRFP